MKIEILKKIIGHTKKEVKAWDKRTGVVHKAPYPSDSPCYYCRFNLRECDYCINNADNKLLELFNQETK